MMAKPAPRATAAAPRVNLMPRSEMVRRERAALIRRWAWLLVGALALVSAVVVVALWFQWSAQLRLLAENTRTTQLLGQLSDLGEVRAAVDLEAELDEFRTQAMGTDTDWPAVVELVENAAPDGVDFVGFAWTAGALPAGADPALEVGVTGTVTFTSAEAQEITTLIRRLRAQPGVLDADGWELTSAATSDRREYTYLLDITVDQSVYTGAYAEEDQR